MTIQLQMESTQRVTMDNTEMCAVASNLEDRNPPLVICRREERMADGRPKFHIISDTDGWYDRLFFVLLFPDGENGWNPIIKCVDGKTKLTLQKYSVYLLQESPNSTSSIMTAHKLMQQYAVMAFARDQAHILKYHWKNISTKWM